MIKHVVMFWLKDKSEKQITDTINMLKSMDGKIPGMLKLDVGRDLTNSTRSCDICLDETFADMKSLENYRTHPIHLPILEHIRSIASQSTSADFEVDN